MITIILCEDNKTHSNYIKQLLSESIEKMTHIANMTNISVLLFDSGHELMEYCEIKSHQIDVLICDIELDDMNGIHLAKNIKHLRSNIQIIFLSAHVRYFEDVYSVDHIYFLSKPIDKHKFYEALYKAISTSLENKNNFITVATKNSVYAVNLNDIYYIETALRKINIHTIDTFYSKYEKLTKFVDSLDQRFIICHKSFAINMDKVTKLGKHNFILNNQIEIPISQLKYSCVKTQFINYIGKIPNTFTK